MKKAIAAIALIFGTIGTWAQSSVITPTSVDLHINQDTSRDQLAQMQRDLQAAGIGFRYDLVSWEENALKSIRMAIILPDGTLQTEELDAFNNDTDLRILLAGEGEDRVFCVGINCLD